MLPTLLLTLDLQVYWIQQWPTIRHLTYHLSNVFYYNFHYLSKLWWLSNLIAIKKTIFVAFYTPVFRRDVLWYGDVRPGLRPSVRPSVRLSVRPVSVRPFSALFSYMLWHIELKFCTWLSFDVLQIKFNCRHFASIFEGVMPLCELRIKVICSFPHFSPTCFDIFSSNFASDFVSPYYRSSSSAVNLR